LESVIIQMCKQHFQLRAYRMCNIGYTGVWCDEKKLAALGIHCKRYVTYHGLAVNCTVDLEWFRHIVPCGIEDKAVTSLSQLLGREVGVDEVRPRLVEAFGKSFKADLVNQKSESETREMLGEFVE
jgi:lipoate-protein ligase B